MKTILIEQVANGWILRDRDDYSLNSYKPGDIHVYRTIEELQADLPRLLGEEPCAPCPSPDDIVLARERALRAVGATTSKI